MHIALSQTEHRPWPLPRGAWRWRQSWCDLMFAHWPVPASELRPLVPPELTVQEIDGTSWVGVVPFRMAGVMLRPFPDIPGVSAFPELNVRLYVEHQGKPGVWFLSLDATNVLAVWGGRHLFDLPYHLASMELDETTHGIRFASRRRGRASGAAFGATYRPTSEPYLAEPGSLLHWLTERYCLYAKSRDGKLYRTEVHHHPWPIQDVSTEIAENGMLALHGLNASGAPRLAHFARQIDVVVWSPEVA